MLRRRTGELQRITISRQPGIGGQTLPVREFCRWDTTSARYHFIKIHCLLPSRVYLKKTVAVIAIFDQQAP
jgi:hypothetical protein